MTQDLSAASRLIDSTARNLKSISEAFALLVTDMVEILKASGREQRR